MTLYTNEHISNTNFLSKIHFTYLSNSVVRVEAVPAVMWWELGYTLHSANLKQNPNQKRHSLEAVMIARYKGLEDCCKYITDRLVMTHMSHDLDQDAFMRSGWHQCRRKGHRRDHENFQAARKLDERVRRTKIWQWRAQTLWWTKDLFAGIFEDQDNGRSLVRT